MTAVTRAGTLSRVMISWGGTSMVTVLRSTFTILSTNGSRMKSPGPLGPPWTRPRRKMTPRSYSLTIFTALVTSAKTTTTTTIKTTPAPIGAACNKAKSACTGDTPFDLVRRVELPRGRRPIDGHYLHYPSLTEASHNHFAPHPYQGLAVSRTCFLGGER